MNDSDLINFIDLHDGSLTKGTDFEFKELDEHSHILFEEIVMFDTYDFALLLVLLTVIILAAFRFFLNRFEFSLWKTKRMLGILPTKYMAEQISDIKALIKQIA